MKKRGLWFIVYGLWLSLLFPTPARAEEEIGLVQKLWRKMFKRPAAAQRMGQKDELSKVPAADAINNPDLEKEETVVYDEAEPIDPEEEEARRDLVKDLERQKDERAILESIKRAQEAQRNRPQPPR